jgi:hypothetical protein
MRCSFVPEQKIGYGREREKERDKKKLAVDQLVWRKRDRDKTF